MVHWTHQPHADIKNKEAHCNDSLYRNKNQPNSTMHARLLLKGIVEMTLLYCQFSTPSLHLDDVILVLWTSSISSRRKKTLFELTQQHPKHTSPIETKVLCLLFVCMPWTYIFSLPIVFFFFVAVSVKNRLTNTFEIVYVLNPIRIVNDTFKHTCSSNFSGKRKHEAKKHTLSRKKTVLSIE